MLAASLLSRSPSRELMKRTIATAHSNIALIKYWGKRPETDPALNLPAVGSLSLTLDKLWTETTIEPASADAFLLDGSPVEGGPAQRVWAQLDRLWATQHRDTRPPVRVASTNHFPTAAGLASSASGFAALTVAATHAFELDLGVEAQSAFARMGSGSAARSIFGGFVRLDRGSSPDGRDCVARPLPDPAWPLAMVVVQTTRGPKPIGSTDGMQNSRQTSPYYPAWVDTSEHDLNAAEAAIAARDLERLGELVEHSAFKMHACMMATRPPLVYWTGTTVDVFQRVWALRNAGGPSGYVTMDAGPHVKVLCERPHASAIADACRDVPGVEAIDICDPGPAASTRELD